LQNQREKQSYTYKLEEGRKREGGAANLPNSGGLGPLLADPSRMVPQEKKIGSRRRTQGGALKKGTSRPSQAKREGGVWQEGGGRWG